MTPTFHKLLQYDVTVTCLSPLRTGNGDGILRDMDGNLFLQGSSLCGALRSWRNDDVLFGLQEQAGELIVSDLIFEEDTQIASRPRVRIDSKSGTASDGGLFRVECLVTGSHGHFTLTWRGTRKLSDVRPQVEAYLAALHNGHILLGAQKTNGFGRVSLGVNLREFDLMDPSQLSQWLSDGGHRKPVQLPETVNDGTILFRVEGTTPSILVKASDGTAAGGEGFHAVPYQENGSYLIPGSSIKGALRAQLERIAGQFHMEAQVRRMLGFAADGSQDGCCGTLFFSDGHFTGEIKETTRARIRLDRFTGGTYGGALFKDRVLSGTLNWEIRLPEHDDTACAMLLFALRDLGLGLYTLGSGGSVGRGRLDSLTVQAGDIVLIVENGDIRLSDPSGMAEKWFRSWEEAVHENSDH